LADASRASEYFDEVADSYDRLRPVDGKWQELFDLLVAEGTLAGRRTLDVGCGTGTFAAALAGLGGKVWGIDSSSAMLAQAQRRPTRARFKVGRAEALPFKDAWFERVVMRLSLHHFDRPPALAEAQRVLVPGGRILVATFDPAHFEGYWLNALFPSVAKIDGARFPDAGTLAQDFEDAGLADVAIDRLSQSGRLSRAEALERIRGRYISTLRLIDEREYQRGLAAAEDELPQRIEYRLEWLIASARKPALDAVRTGG
jgi:SAM-dependent methyltransferase